MKKFLFIILAAAICASCDIDKAGNGGIYGNWQLREIDTIATGGVCDMSKTNIYWSFESDVMQIRQITAHNLKILFSFEQEGDSIVMHNPLHVSTKDDLIAIDDVKLLKEFGITGLKDVFFINRNKNGSLIIDNKTYRLKFRRY